MFTVLLIFNVLLIPIISRVEGNNEYCNIGMASDDKIISVEFEVFGQVQGVFFRKYTQTEAKRLGLKGWCMNTSQGTVKGVIEGGPQQVNEMKNWLQKVGSPSSRIERTVFSSPKDIAKYSFESFKVKH